MFRQIGGLNESGDDNQGNAKHRERMNGKGGMQKSRTTNDEYTPLRTQYVALRNAQLWLVLVVE